MKGVVLAAGKGSRLNPMTSYIPKPLLPVDGERIIDRVISYLSAGCEEIFIVSGYLHNLLERYLKSKYLNIKVIRVDRVPSGNLYTLLQAKDFLEGHEFIIANADHIFPREIWDFFPTKRGGIQLACHKKGTRVFLEDEMKVKVKDGKLLKMDKKLKDYDGAYTGLAYIGEGTWEIFWKFAQKLFFKLRDTAKVEDVFNFLAGEKQPEIVWIDNVRFYEIDTIEDLRRVWNESKAGAVRS